MMKQGLVVLVAALGLLPVGMVQASLVSHYTFDNTAVNSVAGAPDGTVVGATYVTGKAGTGALRFDGSATDYVDTTASGLPAGNGLVSGTIAMWIKTSTTGMQKLMCSANSNDAQSFDFNTTTDGLEFYLRSAEDHYLKANALFSSSALDGQWHHVAVTWTATTASSGTGTIAMYLDGVSQSIVMNDNQISSSDTWNAWDNPMRIAIGGRVDPGWEHFDGLLDEVRVYNNVLSGQEIAGLVPEPATITLLVLGALGGLVRRKR